MTITQDIIDYTGFVLSTHSFITFSDNDSIVKYDPVKGYYVSGRPDIIKISVLNPLTSNPNGLNILLQNIRGRTYSDRKTFHDHEGLINFQNGVYDLQDEKLYLHDKKYHFLNRIEIPFIEGAKCPVWEKSMNYALPNKEDYFQLKKWFGYHLIEGQPYEKAMFITGVPSSGKSTALAVLDMLLDSNSCHHPLSDFANKSTYASADLYMKLANTYADMGQQLISDVGVFKTLTGSLDTITARFPYEKPFSFVNPAKLTFACNKLPPLSHSVQSDNAFWKRVLLLEFHNKVLEVDKEIYSKLRNELSGILNWMIDGYYMLQEEGFADNENAFDTWTNSAYAQNPIDDFLETIIKDTNCFCPIKDFQSMYEKHCLKTMRTPLTHKDVKIALVGKGIFQKKKWDEAKGAYQEVYSGVSLY